MKKTVLVKSIIDYAYAVTAKKLFNRPDISFEDWVTNRFGKTLYDIYFGIYTQKIWGIPPSEISADWAAQRISLLNLRDVLLRLLGKEDDRPKTYALEFAYPKMGIGRICERMSEEAKKHGGRIITGANLKKAVLEEEFIKEIKYEKEGKEFSISADWYISTIPMSDFIMSIRPRVSKEYLQVADSISFPGETGKVRGISNILARYYVKDL